MLKYDDLEEGSLITICFTTLLKNLTGYWNNGKKAIELGVPESKITYIPGGADIDLIYPRPKEEVRKLLGLPIDKKIIAYTAGTHYDSDLFLRTIYDSVDLLRF